MRAVRNYIVSEDALNQFEFVCELIDVQYQIYYLLATVDFGPDAGLIGMLAKKEVDDLIQFAKELLTLIDFRDPTCSLFCRKKDPIKTLDNIFQQILFYYQQENLRGQAAWLLDQNNIHVLAYAQLAWQKEKLKEITRKPYKYISERAEPMTESQRQCEHDNNEITYRVLKIAIDLLENPETKLEQELKHIEQRLNEEKIKDLYQQCDDFKASSKRKKSELVLSKDEAKKSLKLHQAQLNELLFLFKKLHPGSRLFREDHRWSVIKINESQNREIEEPKPIAPAPKISNQYLKIFGATFIMTSSAVALGIRLSASQENNRTYSGSGPPML